MSPNSSSGQLPQESLSFLAEALGTEPILYYSVKLPPSKESHWNLLPAKFICSLNKCRLRVFYAGPGASRREQDSKVPAVTELTFYWGRI